MTKGKSNLLALLVLAILAAIAFYCFFVLIPAERDRRLREKFDSAPAEHSYSTHSAPDGQWPPGAFSMFRHHGMPRWASSALQLSF